MASELSIVCSTKSLGRIVFSMNVDHINKDHLKDPTSWQWEDDEMSIDDENLHEHEAFDDSSARRWTMDHPASSLLEEFSDDITTLIFSHLTLEDIAAVSRVSKRCNAACRSNELWKRLFGLRWNVHDYDEADWYRAYQRAHAHPHDLWVTHWNCVWAGDGLAAGRTILPEATGRRIKRPPLSLAHEATACPACRDWETFSAPDEATPARMVAAATCRTRQRLGRYLPDSRPLRTSDRARRAFATAATFHRCLDTSQYEPSPTRFLSDLLFFNLTDPVTSEGQWELRQLLAESTLDSDDGPMHPNHQVTNHSWHVIRLSNPDFYRPLVYQIGIQRPDCFTAYPSEGLLPPGDSCFVTIGVRPLGSALAYAFEGLNVYRDGLDPDWADLYTDQAHLTLAPFLIRYRFATVSPLWMDECIADPRRRPERNREESKSEKHAALDYHWKQKIPAHHLRSIHLSAHVHAHYQFATFLASTCQPFDLDRDIGPVFVAPALQEHYPDVHRRLENVERDETALLVRANNEGPCRDCGRWWGTREEELAHAFWLMRGRCSWYRARICLIVRNIRTALGVLNASNAGSAKFRASLLYQIACAVQELKAAPWTSTRQRSVLVEAEATADNLFRKIATGGVDWVPWRTSGVYEARLCSLSVFGGDETMSRLIDVDVEWKDEPDYLDSFRHLAHSPGRYCLGPQEDPNHLGETCASTRRYYRRQRGLATDLVMDDAISSFQSGICMMQDPTSLLVHGLYDRVPYPGTVVRRPKHQIAGQLFSLNEPGLSDDALLGMDFDEKQLAYWRVQDAFSLQPSRHQGEAAATTSCRFLSMDNFLSSIPPAGTGRFALSQLKPAINPRRPSVEPFELLLDDTASVISVDTSRDRANIDPVARGNPHRVVVPPRNIRGPRFLQFFWILGAQLGLAVIDNPHLQSVFVDRRILIASQWVCISLMAVPLLLTLCARYAQWIPVRPLDYDLEGVPFYVGYKLRYLTENECGMVACVLVFIWLALGRWNERHTCRDYFRVMLEHVSPPFRRRVKHLGLLSRCIGHFALVVQRQWDAVCPLFLQRRVFSPKWNCRTQQDLLRHLAFWRSRNLGDRRVAIPLAFGRIFGDQRDEGVDIGSESQARNVVVGVGMALGSFCASSPHFWLNLFAVFSCSIGLGMSVSLHSMEKGASGVSVSSNGSLITTLSLVTVVILACLVGQLVGSSGGTMFLAEFIVTSISLILGGAGTISASAMESWGCFFVLSGIAFWGYLFGRVALMDGMRSKRNSYASLLLSKSVTVLCVFWMLVLIFGRWERPVDILVDYSPPLDRKQAARKLQ